MDIGSQLIWVNTQGHDRWIVSPDFFQCFLSDCGNVKRQQGGPGELWGVGGKGGASSLTQTIHKKNPTSEALSPTPVPFQFRIRTQDIFPQQYKKHRKMKAMGNIQETLSPRFMLPMTCINSFSEFVSHLNKLPSKDLRSHHLGPAGITQIKHTFYVDPYVLIKYVRILNNWLHIKFLLLRIQTGKLSTICGFHSRSLIFRDDR